MRSHKASIHWFRKGLRLHDNPALSHAVSCSESVFPVFVIDPWFANEDFVGIRRYKFLLESLEDLDRSLRKKNSRLYVARGKPEEVLPELFKRFGATLLTFEKDTEPYARKRDSSMTSFASSKIVISLGFPKLTGPAKFSTSIIEQIPDIKSSI